MPLGVVRVAPVDVRAKLSIYRIIRITISVFSITEEIGAERGQELGARPLSGSSVGPLPRALLTLANTTSKLGCHPQHDRRNAVLKYAIALLNK